MAGIESLSFVFELIGTVAFAASGALVAIEKKMDIFGVIMLGLTTALGGGVIRDVILGNNPPAAFTNYLMTASAVAAAILLFLPPVRKSVEKNRTVFDKIMLIMDSVGLGIFTVIGIEIARERYTNVLLLLFVGVVTGVGGGVLRDVLAGNIPYIFSKHFYASASFIGAIMTVALWGVLGDILAMTTGVAVIFILRLMAAHYHWKLPRA